MDKTAGQDLAATLRRPAAGAAGLRHYYMLLLLGLAFGFSTLDRVVMSVLVEPIKAEFGISDTQIGLLTGFAFALFNALAVVPIGMLADKTNRRNLVTACLTIWSAMTAFGAAAGTFVQLLLIRITVGVGEGGCSAPSLSMIADSFPAARRATAISVFYIFGPAGGLVALALGGWLAGNYGWRMTLVALGLPGLLVAALILFTVAEPERGRFDTIRPDAAERAGVRDALWVIMQCRTLRHITAGITLIAFFISGIATWTVTFFVRSHGMEVQHVGPILAVFQVAGLLGPLFGGLISDRLARRDRRWWCWMVAIGLLLASAAHLLLTISGSLPVALTAAGIYSLAVAVWYGPSFGMVQSLAPARMRTTVTATITVLTNVIGYGLGTQIVGVLSDLLAPAFGRESLRYALMSLAVAALWAAWHFVLASGSLVEDLARERDEPAS